MPVSCGRRLSAPPTQLKALPQLRAVIQWAMHAQSNKTVDIRDIRDFSLALAGFVVSAAGFVVSYASSDFRMKRLAVKKFMALYRPPRPKSKVVHRETMTAIKNRVQNWKQEEHATIVSGRYKCGKTVAVQEALRDVRGVWGFTIEVEDWKPVLYQELGVKDSNMFREVLRCVRTKLQKKKYANNLTQYPILLLDIPRSAKGGMDLVSTAAKDMSSDSSYNAPAHAVVVASSAASAQAFDAGGRRFDIWVGDMTQGEATEMLEKHDHKSDAAEIINKCALAWNASGGLRAGDLVDACNDLKKGDSLSDIQTRFQEMAVKDVVNFMSLTLDGKPVGRQILKALLQSSGAGIRAVINTTAYEPSEIAKLIRDKKAHAIIWHPTDMLYKFASSLHAKIAKDKMALIDMPGEKDVLSLLSYCAASWCTDVLFDVQLRVPFCFVFPLEYFVFSLEYIYVATGMYSQVHFAPKQFKIECSI
ncbi:unnamed protein product [Symbiodinium sp. CCMP2592]|nr:unnamed protein product [Symbiodinium sp. CCMP2592]